MKDWRRYEVLLPLSFNDGAKVPRRLFLQTVKELEARFGAVSIEKQVIEGRWRDGSRSYRDNLLRIYVDAEGRRGHLRS